MKMAQRTKGVKILLAASLAVLAGCSAHGPAPEGQQAASDFDSDPVTVRVENRSWDLVRVYALGGVHRRFLGQVNSQQTRSYEVPSTMLRGQPAELALVAVPPSGSAGGFTSQRVLVVPGDRVRWTLQPERSASTIQVD